MINTVLDTKHKVIVEVFVGICSGIASIHPIPSFAGLVTVYQNKKKCITDWGLLDVEMVLLNMIRPYNIAVSRISAHCNSAPISDYKMTPLKFCAPNQLKPHHIWNVCQFDWSSCSYAPNQFELRPKSIKTHLLE